MQEALPNNIVLSETPQRFGVGGAEIAQIYFDLGAGRREEPYGERAEVIFRNVLDTLARAETLTPDNLLALLDHMTALRHNLFDVQEKLQRASVRKELLECERVRRWFEGQEALVWRRMCLLRPTEARALQTSLAYAEDDMPSFALAVRAEATITKTTEELQSLLEHYISEGGTLRTTMRKRRRTGEDPNLIRQKIARNTERVNAYTAILEARQAEHISS